MNFVLYGGLNSYKYVTVEEEKTTCPHFGTFIEKEIFNGLWVNASFDFLIIAQIEDSFGSINYTPVIGEFGVTKKFVKGKLKMYAGVSFGLNTTSVEIASYMTKQDVNNNFKYSAYGFKVRSGFEYFLNDVMFLDLGIDYRIYGQATEDGGFEESDNFFTPNGFVIRTGIGFSI